MAKYRKVKGGAYAGQYHLPVGPHQCGTCDHGYDKRDAVAMYHRPALMRCGKVRDIAKNRATLFPQDADCCKRYMFQGQGLAK